MPYNPQISYDTTSVANGVNGATQNVMNGFQQMQMNKAKSTAAAGIVTGLLQSNPELLQGADDKTLKLLNKFKEGNTGLNDNVMLAGWASTTQKGWEQKQQMLAQKQQMDAQRIQMQVAQNQLGEQQRVQQQGRVMDQYNSGVGRGVLSAKIQDNPFFQKAAMVRQATGETPSPKELLDSVQKEGAHPQMVFKSLSELEKKYPNEKYDYNFMEAPDGSGRVIIPDGKISPRAPLPPQPEIPNPLVEKIYTDLSSEREKKVMPALNTLRSYDTISRILDSDDGKVISGQFANGELFLKRAANALGAKNADVSNTETVRALFATPVAQIIQNFGSGTGLSDADRDFAQKAAGGDITLTPATIRRLVKIGQEASENIKSSYAERLDNAFPDKTDNASFKQARKALLLPEGKRGDEKPKGAADSILEEFGIGRRK